MLRTSVTGGGVTGAFTDVEPLRSTVTDAEDQDSVDRAKELQARLVVLRLREGTANFENREAIRREINRIEEELAALGIDPESVSEGS